MNPYLEVCLSHKISAKDTPTEPLDGEPRDSVARQPGERIRKGIEALRRTPLTTHGTGPAHEQHEARGIRRRRTRAATLARPPAPQGRVARHQRAA